MKTDFFNHFNILKRNTPNVIILTGDEPYQKEKILEHIIQIYTTTQTEVIKHTIESKLEQSWIQENIENYSLFSDHRLFIINFNKIPDNITQKNLIENMSIYNSNDTFIFNIPKLTKKQYSQIWYKKLEKIGCHIPIWQPSTKEFIKILQLHAKNKKTTITNDAILIILRHNEGNLLAACQILDQAISFNEKSLAIRPEHISKYVYNSKQYEIFELVNYILTGDIIKTLQILEFFKEIKTVEIGQIIGIISREIRIIIKLISCTTLKEKKNIFQSNQIWQSKEIQYKRLSKIKNKELLYNSLEICHKIDIITKGVQAGDPWLMLNNLCFSLTKNNLEL